jgi:hypothetical protein
MEKKQVTLENPTRIAGLTFLPLTQTLVFSWQNKGRLTFFGLKKPLYVLILNAEKKLTSFSIEGQEIPPEEILSQYPEIREKLDLALTDVTLPLASNDGDHRPQPEERLPAK